MSGPNAIDALIEAMEPAVAQLGTKWPITCHAAVSQAISLKRIADALDGTTVNCDISYSLAGIGLRIGDRR